MFSGLTNQVSSWMGSNKTETHEEVPAVGGESGSAIAATRTEEDNLLGTATAQPLQQTENVEVPLENVGEDGDKKHSPTKAGGLFSGVKSQMTGWLGNASIPSMPAMPAMPSMPSIPHIPGLRKHNAENDAEGGVKSPSGDAAQQPLGDSDPAHGDDEDKSSATEGADSGPSSPQPGTPTEEQAGQIGNVTTKVTQSAKTFGSFLYSAVNKAGAKIKKTVEDAHILGEFNKEQEAFMKSQTGKTDAAVPPWIGHKNESSVKEEILTLSSDRRNFVRAPPAGVEFEFSYDVSYSVALAIMAEDPALEKMRFELVPKIITEENFWRNYFYRVSLICQAGDLGTLGEDSLAGGSNEDADDKKPKKDAVEVVVDSENLEQKASKPSDSSTSVVDVKANENVDDSTINNISNANNSNNNNNNKNKKKNSKKNQTSKSNKQLPNESEFVSDTFQTTESDLKEVENGMRILGIDTLAKQALENDKYMDEQWEKDLEAELQEYEMVVDDKQDINWEADVDELLNDATDLK